MRSAREIAASGHFDPETMGINPQPDEANGTVDIVFDLESKANDKVQLSFGWGQTGVTGQVALSFSNFSMKNLFNPGSIQRHHSAWRRSDILYFRPDQRQILSELQHIVLRSRLGGNRPNSLSVSLDYSRSTGINSSFYNDNWANAFQNAIYNQYTYNTNYSQYAIQDAYDPQQKCSSSPASALASEHV